MRCAHADDLRAPRRLPPPAFLAPSEPPIGNLGKVGNFSAGGLSPDTLFPGNYLSCARRVAERFPTFPTFPTREVADSAQTRRNPPFFEIRIVSPREASLRPSPSAIPSRYLERNNRCTKHNPAATPTTPGSHAALEARHPPPRYVQKGKPMKTQKTAPHLEAPAPDEVEARARCMMAAAERLADAQFRPRSPFVAEKALDYYRAEAKRQLAAPRAPVSGSEWARNPLAALPGAAPCRGCGRPFWRSPASKGTRERADLCRTCVREVTP